MKTKIVTIAMLIVSSSVQAGLIQTVVEMPGKAVEATGTIVKDVVTAPENIVKDTVTAPGKVIGAVPMEEKKEVVQPNHKAPVAEQKEMADMRVTSTEEQVAALPEKETLPEETPALFEEEETQTEVQPYMQ